MEEDYVELNGKVYKYTIVHKKIKNINMRIKAGGEIVISAPKRVSNLYIKKFVTSKINWIDKQIQRLNNIEPIKEKLLFENDEKTYFLGRTYKLKIISSDKNKLYISDEKLCLEIKSRFIENNKYIEKTYDKLLKEYAYELLEKLTIIWQKKMEKYNIPMPEIEIKRVKTKWGSCTPSKNKVQYNLKLMNVPISCIEYVVIHELSHFKYMNHSKQFYNFIEKFIPDWKERRKILNKQYGNVV